MLKREQAHTQAMASKRQSKEIFKRLENILQVISCMIIY